MESPVHPKRPEHIPQEDLFRSQLDQIINMKHELVKLAHAIDCKRHNVNILP